MKSKLLRNWKAKLIALGLATVVWFLVKAYLDRGVPAKSGAQGQQETGRSVR